MNYREFIDKSDEPKDTRPVVRLAMNLPIEFHRDLKLMATMRGISITKYVMQALAVRLNEDKKNNS